jgi:hypothetical protein
MFHELVGCEIYSVCPILPCIIMGKVRVRVGGEAMLLELMKVTVLLRREQFNSIRYELAILVYCIINKKRGNIQQYTHR